MFRLSPNILFVTGLALASASVSALEAAQEGHVRKAISVDASEEVLEVIPVPTIAPTPSVAPAMVPTLSRILQSFWVPGVGGCGGTTCFGEGGDDDDDWTPAYTPAPTPRATPRPTYNSEATQNDFFWPGISVTSRRALSVNLRLDDYPSETTWTLERWGTVEVPLEMEEPTSNGTSTSTTVSRGNTSTTFSTEQWVLVDQSKMHPEDVESGQFYSYVYTGLESATYRFTIEDSAGDGLCCGFGEGWVSLLTSKGILWSITDSYEFSSKQQVTMSVDGGGTISAVPNACAWVAWLEEGCNGGYLTSVRSTLAEFQEVMSEQGSLGLHLVALDYSESEMKWVGFFQQLPGTFRWHIRYTWDDFLEESESAQQDGYRAEALYYGDGIFIGWWRYDPSLSSKCVGVFGNTAFWNVLNEELEAGRHLKAGFGTDAGFWFACFEHRIAGSTWNHAFSISQLQAQLSEYWMNDYYVTAVAHSATDGWIIWAEVDYSSSGWASRETVGELSDWIVDNWEGYCVSVLTYGCEY